MERLLAARGSVRDSLGAIHNLERLLKSIRVGPKALTSVIPDVQASCAPLLRSFRELLTALAKLGEAPQVLDAFVAPRIESLEEALATSRKGPLNAKQRLALEATVTRAAAELDAARALVELLELAVESTPVPLQLVEVVRAGARANDGGERAASEKVRVHLVGDAELEALVHPRVGTSLVGAVVRLVVPSGQGTAACHVSTLVDARGATGLRFENGVGPGDALELGLPHPIEPAHLCTLAAATACGAELRFPTEHEATLLWGPK